jgi:muramoyltetrapeptide carboxypeptidase LdcA involved in peptidoglycan recycling/ABC-type multidrug transport system ATPase subunit
MSLESTKTPLFKTWRSLKKNSIIDIIAPASGVCDPAILEQLKTLLKSWQLIPRFSADLFGHDLLCANSDEKRFQQLQEALSNTSSDAIWCLRGGYGCTRLLPSLLKLTAPKKCKLFIGFSDITALHLFLQQKWHWQTLHGPSINQVVNNLIDKENSDELRKVIFGELNQLEYLLKPYHKINNSSDFSDFIQAPLTGGSLTLIQASLGTDWQIETRDKILFLEDISKAYGEKVILKRTSATINRGDKIALIGANGKGKSTLLRIIAGTEVLQGSRQEGHNVIKSFFAQHQLEALTLDNEIIQEMSQAGSKKTEMELRGVLGCFLFSNEEVYKKIKVLSGGEKSRVALAKTLISEANFLLLDEPTNHLDFQSVNILIQALQQYEGTFITVSHDRHFIKGVANKIWYIEQHEIKEYPGTYEEYEFWRSQQLEVPATAAVQKPVKVEVSTPKSKEDSQQAKRELKKLEEQLQLVEKEISQHEAKKKELEDKLADPSLYLDEAKAQKIQASYQQVEESLETANTSWEKLVDQISQLQQQATLA